MPKKKNGKKPETETVILELRCELTPEELAVVAQHAALTQRELEEKEHELALLKAEYKKKMEFLGLEVRNDLLTLRRKWQMQDVECERETDFGSGSITIVRCDTGEIVSTRALRDDERQGELQPQAPPDPDQDQVDRTPAGG